MEDWPKPRWGHPLPGWSKYLLPFAKRLLLSLAIFIVGGVSFSYYYVEWKNRDRKAPTIKDVYIPLPSRYFEQARDFVRVRIPDAEVISILLLRHDHGSKKTTYFPILEFCVPDSALRFQVEVDMDQRYAARDRFVGQDLGPYEGPDTLCVEKRIQITNVYGASAIIIAQEHVETKYAGLYESLPISLELSRNEEDILHWRILFTSLVDKDKTLLISLNANSGDILEIEVEQE